MPIPVASKRAVHYPVLCYHGCVRARAEMATFRQHVDDFIAEVQYLQRQGFTFVLPSVYVQWYTGAYDPPAPIACIHLDDGLASIETICDWLVDHGVPFGLAVIGRRQRKHEPDDGFASWSLLRRYVDSGLGELLNHTYNLHHLTLVPANGGVDVGPVMDAPCWVDGGDVVYRQAGDQRWYWDFSFVDSATWGFPLYGSDPYRDFSVPITSTLTITPKFTGTVSTLRLWQGLGRPYSGGYDAQVEIRINGTLRWSGVIAPKDYGIRQQWVEREFYSIALSSPFAVTAGVAITMEFKTLNAGPGVMTLYALPDLSGDFGMTTTCQGLTPKPDPARLPWTDDLWPLYADFPAGANWPARPAIILASGGAVASDADYQGYVGDDLAANNAAIDQWLNAAWTEHAQTYRGDPNGLGSVVIGGQYADGTLADTAIPFDCPATHTAEVIRIRNAGPHGLERYAMLLEVSIGESATGPWTVLTEYASRWRHFKWEEIDIPPTPLTGGTRYWFRFRTLNPNPWSWPVATLQRIYLDSTFAAHGGGNTPQRITVTDWDFSGVDFGLDKRTAVVARIEGSDVWPTGIEWDGPDWSWVYGLNSVVGNAYLETLSAAHAPAAAPTQMIYPFGAYYEQGTGGLSAQNIQSISAPLQGAISGAGCTHGFTIWPARYSRPGVFRERDNRYTAYTLGRLLMYGSIDPEPRLDAVDAYVGTLFADAPHAGVRWQTSVEPDPAGNATVRRAVAALDFVAFDAWFFDGAGGIQRGRLNDGGTYLELTGVTGTYVAGETVTEATSGATAVVTWWSTVGVLRLGSLSGTWTGGRLVTGGTSGATGTGVAPGPVTYADDRAWLQARGVRCLLILNNNLATGEPDPAIGAHVVDNPGTYVPLIVSAAAGWDGITCNLEAIPADRRAAASSFYTQLADALHADGKLLHATAPATTGTEYDYLPWTGWCDHQALARVCDAVKILTYTETGPGTLPGSASPDWHFDASIAWLKAQVHEAFWPRLLLGARAFGHLWADAADPDTADYVSYAEAVAEGLVAGAKITQQDGEGTWQAGSRACWFGSPETVRRSARRAAAEGFGGVGVWKADDGDLFEHWPLWPQIGVDDMAAFSEERFPDDWAWFAIGGPAYKNYITAGDSDFEARISVGDQGLRRYTLDRELHSQSEIDWFLAFWQLRRGPFEGFRMRDWRDYQATGQQLGVGNGTQTGFQLVKKYTNTDPVTGGSSTVTRVLTKPVQGTVKVYKDGVLQGSGYTVNYATGLVSFTAAPAAGVIVTADCAFDVPVRFEQDDPPLQFDPNFGLARLSGLRLREVRV